MKNTSKLLFLISLLIVVTSSQEKEISSSKNNVFYTINMGASQFTSDNGMKKSGVNLSSKLGLSLERYAFYIGSEGMYYYDDKDDFLAIGLVGPGVDFYIPQTQKKLSIGAVAGLGMSVNYSTLFDDFKNSMYYGGAVKGSVNYKLTKKWNTELAFSKYNISKDDFDSKVVSLSIGYDLGGRFASQLMSLD